MEYEDQLKHAFNWRRLHFAFSTNFNVVSLFLLWCWWCWWHIDWL